jgi:hypothetical protein
MAEDPGLGCGRPAEFQRWHALSMDLRRINKIK